MMIRRSTPAFRVAFCLAIFAFGCGGEAPESRVAQPALADNTDPPPASANDDRREAGPPSRETEAKQFATPATELIQPADLVYRGAFRLPEGSGGTNWEYSGYAMTYCPQGDPQGPDDGYPGSLFAVGHDHRQLVSEISIPVPVASAGKSLDQLNVDQTLQPFHDIRGGFFGELEIPRAALEYLPGQGEQDSGKLHFAWGQRSAAPGCEARTQAR